MTASAKEFVSPLTFSTLSKRRVLSDIIAEDEWNSHVDLGLWADAMVIAPYLGFIIGAVVVGWIFGVGALSRKFKIMTQMREKEAAA